MEEIRRPCRRKFKVKRDKESDRTGLSDVQLWKHTSHSICSFINLSHGPWSTNPGGGWHSRARGVKNTSSGSCARARVWGRGLRWWHGWRRPCACVRVCDWARTRLYVCKRLQLHDSARLFWGLQCRRASCLVNWLLFWGSCRRHRCLPGRDEAFRNLFNSQAGEGVEGASGDTWHASSQCVWLASEDLTATRHKQKPARKTCFRFLFFFLGSEAWKEALSHLILGCSRIAITNETPCGCWHDRFKHVGISKQKARLIAYISDS